MPHRRGIGLADLVVALLVSVTVSTVLLAAAQRSREAANRAKCSANLRQIGLACRLYGNENRGAFPRAIYDLEKPVPVWGTPYEGNDSLTPPDPMDRSNPEAGPDPFAADDKPNTKFRPAPNDVTAALFLLMRTQDIASDSFICPSARIKRWDFGGGPYTALSWTNWRGNKGIASHLSYSFQNPYASAQAAQTFRWNDIMGAEFAMAADMNPGGPALTRLTLQSPAEEMRGGNSLNHRRDGQNVLYGDAHVDFQTTPFFGMQRDNIFTFNGPELKNRTGDAGIVGSPADGNDSILLPTAADVGFTAPPPIPDEPPADPAAVRAKFVGRYETQTGMPGVGRITVDDNSIRLEQGPVVAEFNYEIIGAEGDQVYLRLTGKDMQPEEMGLTLGQDGNVLAEPENHLSWTGALGGAWKRVRGN